MSDLTSDSCDGCTGSSQEIKNAAIGGMVIGILVGLILSWLGSLIWSVIT